MCGPVPNNPKTGTRVQKRFTNRFLALQHFLIFLDQRLLLDVSALAINPHKYIRPPIIANDKNLTF